MGRKSRAKREHRAAQAAHQAYLRKVAAWGQGAVEAAQQEFATIPNRVNAGEVIEEMRRRELKESWRTWFNRKFNRSKYRQGRGRAKAWRVQHAETPPQE